MHRLGHAIALGIHPDYYGPHERTESVGERLDQIRYDLLNRNSLKDYGVSIDEASLRAERSNLTKMDPCALVHHTYSHNRLSGSLLPALRRSKYEKRGYY